MGCGYICSKPNQFSPSKWKKQVSEFYENSTKACIFYWSSSLESSCRWKTKSCRDMNFAQYINYSRIGRHPENLQTRALSKPSQCPIQQPRPHAAEKITSIFQCLQGECFPPAPAQEVNSAAARCSFWDMCFRQTLCLDGQFLPRVWGTKPPTTRPVISSSPSSNRWTDGSLYLLSFLSRLVYSRFWCTCSVWILEQRGLHSSSSAGKTEQIGTKYGPA